MPPLPVTMLSTPGGSSFSMSFMSSNTLSDVVDDGLKTMQSPAPSAGANFHAAMRYGKFHGTICPTTPIGSLRMRLSALSVSMFAEPSSERMTPAK